MPSLRYLPVMVSGQPYGIPLENIAGVSMLSAGEDTPPADSDAPPPDASEQQAKLPVISLVQLFEGHTPEGYQGKFLITLTSESGACVVLVEGIRPMRIATTGHPLSPLSGHARRLFSQLIPHEDQLILILDVASLLAYIRRIAPDLLGEPQRVA